jgi:hypothetical protein
MRMRALQESQMKLAPEDSNICCIHEEKSR